MKKILDCIGKLFNQHRCPVVNINHGSKFKYVSLIELYLKSSYLSFKNRKEFMDIKTFCIFLGYSKSGHSIIGSLLDAHPNVIIAHEVNVLKLIESGIFNKDAIFSILLENSRMFNAVGRGWAGYSYEVPNQWQGRYDALKVIGDKKGERSTEILKENPAVLQKLKKTIGMKIKYIHHIRNPYDIISRWCLLQKICEPTKDMITYFFSLPAAIEKVKKQISKDEIFEGYHESFINDPRDYLKRLCDFFEVQCASGYLDDCAKIVHKSPHKTRQEVRWDNELVSMVKAQIDKYDFLRNYSFTS